MSKKRKKSFDEKLRLSKEKQDGSQIIIEDSKLKHGDDYREKIIRDNERFQDKFQERQSKRYITEIANEKEGKSSNRRYKLVEEKVQEQVEAQNFNHGVADTPTEKSNQKNPLTYEERVIQEAKDSPKSNNSMKPKADSQVKTQESVFNSSKTSTEDFSPQKTEAKKAQLRKQAESFRKEELKQEAYEESEVYDPLAKDTDNDGIPDRYDHNFKDSDYFESTYDVEDPIREEQIVQESYQQKSASPTRKKERGRKIGKDFRKSQDSFKRKSFEENKYDPLSRDTNNDGIADRFDHDFKDSRYFESTFDVKDQKLKAEALEKAKVKKKQNRKIGEDFRKAQEKREIHQEGSKKKNFRSEGFTRSRGKEGKEGKVTWQRNYQR